MPAREALGPLACITFTAGNGGSAYDRPTWTSSARGLVAHDAWPLTGAERPGSAPADALRHSILVLLIVLRWEQLPFASIGVSRPDVMTGVLAVSVILVAHYLLPLLSTPMLHALGLGGFESGLEAIANQPTWWRVCVALTSGPVEEVLYRGYAVERLGTLTGSLPLGGLLAAAAFGLAHTPFWGLGPALAANLPFGIVMVAAYIWRRDLCATAIAHSGLLLIGLLSV
jgi:uncharacterized protein